MSWNRGLRGESRTKPRPCPTCKRVMSESFLKERERIRGDNIKKALSKVKTKGRPRTIDYDQVRELRKQGYSIKNIAEMLSCSGRTVSRGSIQNAFKTETPQAKDGDL